MRPPKLNALVAALTSRPPSNGRPAGWTTAELARKANVSASLIRLKLHQYQADGRLVVKRAKMPGLGGRVQIHIFYSLRP